MRCIEIAYSQTKCEIPLLINRNMRCIEIDLVAAKVFLLQRINRNMRCIEILLSLILVDMQAGLIET